MSAQDIYKRFYELRNFVDKLKADGLSDDLAEAYLDWYNSDIRSEIFSSLDDSFFEAFLGETARPLSFVSSIDIEGETIKVLITDTYGNEFNVESSSETSTGNAIPSGEDSVEHVVVIDIASINERILQDAIASTTSTDDQLYDPTIDFTEVQNYGDDVTVKFGGGDETQPIASVEPASYRINFNNPFSASVAGERYQIIDNDGLRTGIYTVKIYTDSVVCATGRMLLRDDDGVTI